MTDWLLEKLKERRKDAEEKIKEKKQEIEELEEEIKLNKNLVKTEDYTEDMSENDKESLGCEISALEAIKSWHESRLEEAEQDERLFDFKIKYREHQKK